MLTSDLFKNKTPKGVSEGVAETLPMDDALKVLRQYGASHFKTTSNELHFYKAGRPFSVDLIFNDDATRSVSLSQLNSAGRKLKGQGVAEAQNDYFKRRKDEEDRIAGVKAPAKRTPKQTDYEKKRKQQDVTESYPKHQDLSGISTDKLKAYLAKQSQQSVPGEGNQIKRVRAELQSREQGLAEVSKATLDRYVEKAVDAHGHADFSARMSKDDPSLRSYHKSQAQTAEKRRQGISRALDRMSKTEGVAEGGFKNKTAVFSGYSNYMRSRAPNVFQQLGIKVLNKEYFEDEDIIEYTVISDGDSLAKARATLETNPKFGGMILKQSVDEMFADQGAGSTRLSSRGEKRLANTVRKALAKNSETPDQIAARKDFEAQTDARMRQKKKEQGVKEGWDDEDEVDKITLVKSLQWPELVNKVNSAMKAMGWKGQRKDDGSFMFSTRGQLDDEWYIVVIDNRGNNIFTYALGTVEEGDPYIGEQESLPMTEASVSELMIAVREGFGLNESGVAEQLSEQELDEAVGTLELADFLFKGLEQKFPKIIERYGHEAVGNAIMDVAEENQDVGSVGEVDMLIDDVIEKLQNYNRNDSDLAESTVSRLYYNVVGTSAPELRKDFGMRHDQRGWFLGESSGRNRIMDAQRAFGSPKLIEYSISDATGGADTLGPDNVISPVGSVPKSQRINTKKARK